MNERGRKWKRNNDKVQQLEQELGRQKTTQTKVNKARTYNLLDIKEAVEIKPQDYSKSINTKEFQFVQKPKDGIANYTSEDTNSRQGKKGKRGLRSKYDLT